MTLLSNYIDILCYDDGCHLCKYARNTARSHLTDAATRMSTWNIVIDKMHFAGHTDSWCKANCNSNNLKEIEKVLGIKCNVHFSYVSSIYFCAGGYTNL